jgi:hypothetical protein
MGECFYYLKAYGCKKEEVEKIRNFILEGGEAEVWWQDHRDYERKVDPEKTREVFWKEFDVKFPMVSKYLKFIKKHGGDCDNNLAGLIDFGTDEDVEDYFDFIDDYTDDDGIVYGELRYSANVWHFADWDGFAEFLQKEFGVKEVKWVSEEDMNPFDLL